MQNFDFFNYLSPFSWRYGSGEMRRIWSEQHKYELWRKIWVELARAQQKTGLVSSKELQDLEKQQDNVDIGRILEIEKETKHDVVAAIKEFAEKAKIGGGKIHLGATSMDITDNTDVIRMQERLILIEKKLTAVLSIFAQKIQRYAEVPCMGYTHLQPAEPTTVGYRLAFYAQDFLIDYQFLNYLRKTIKVKGLKGAVGTAASYDPSLEKLVMKELGIEPILISSQVYPRKYDFLVLTFLASVASSAAKFAGDLRLLQSAGFGEWSEPFGEKQVGSSAMPFKRNPINSEKICSLARYVSQLPVVVLENASLSYLERTLDDSANKRVLIPEAFLAVDEILISIEKIISGLVLNKSRIALNLARYGPFSATEKILLEAVKNGANRQKIHEVLRGISMKAWAKIQEGKLNPMPKLLLDNKNLAKYLKKDKIKQLMDVTKHIGNAPERAMKLVKQIDAITKHAA